MSLNFLSKSLHTKDGSNRYVILKQYTLITIGGFSQFKQEKQLNLVTEMTHRNQFSARLSNAATFGELRNNLCPKSKY